jgi:hypothetical protein
MLWFTTHCNKVSIPVHSFKRVQNSFQLSTKPSRGSVRPRSIFNSKWCFAHSIQVSSANAYFLKCHLWLITNKSESQNAQFSSWLIFQRQHGQHSERRQVHKIQKYVFENLDVILGKMQNFFRALCMPDNAPNTRNNFLFGTVIMQTGFHEGCYILLRLLPNR